MLNTKQIYFGNRIYQSDTFVFDTAQIHIGFSIYKIDIVVFDTAQINIGNIIYKIHIFVLDIALTPESESIRFTVLCLAHRRLY